MSQFVKEHVTRVFRDAGYELLDIHGDRGGIVQGDGLDLVVTPDIAAAARRFSSDPVVIAGIENDEAASLKLRLSLYGGSASADLEGIWLSPDFVTYLKDECSEIYYKAQREVNAIFDAEDAPNRDWDGNAYVGVIDEFAVETSDGDRLFVTVKRIADQSFNGYESGDEVADREDVASIIEGRSSHGTISIELREIEANYSSGNARFDREFSADAYAATEFEFEDPAHVLNGFAQIWPRDENEAFTLDLAAELAFDEGEPSVAAALRVRAIERGLPQDAEADEAAPPRTR